MTEKFTAKASVVVKATPAQVWEALTTPSMVKQYLFGTDVKSDWQVGSPITYTGVWEGKPYEDHGVILAVEPEKLLSTTYWSPAFGKPDLPENYMQVDYIITPMDDGTQLTIEQSGNPTKESADHSASNWNMVLGGLKKLLEK